MSNCLMQISNVGKNFGEVAALKDVSLTINSGEIVGLVGSNGAGKTTLLRLMSGVYRPSSGSIELENKAPIDDMRGF